MLPRRTRRGWLMPRRQVAKGRAARERRYESAVRRQIALRKQTHNLWVYVDPSELLRAGDSITRYECSPYFCPTGSEVECCSWHSGFDVCCAHPELHEPLRVVTADETRAIGYGLRDFMVTAGHPLTCNGGNPDWRTHHNREVIMLIGDRGLVCPECNRVQELPVLASGSNAVGGTP